MKVCRHDRKNPLPDGCAFCRVLLDARQKAQPASPPKPKREHLQTHGRLAIPPVFHRIWVGRAAIPDRFEQYWLTWKQHHPQAEFRTWTDADIASFGTECVRLCGECRNPAELSDVLRFYIVAEHGGIYLDTDFECYKPLWELLTGWDFVSAWENPTMVASAFFAAVPQHPILARMVRHLAAMTIDKTRSQIKTAGPLAFSERVGDPYEPGVMLYPSALFYHQRYEERHAVPTPAPEAYAVHRWAHTWEDWWTTLTIRIVADRHTTETDYAESLESITDLGNGDAITTDTARPLDTTHACTINAGDRFTVDGIRRIRHALRWSMNYGEMDFAFLDDQGGTLWVQASKHRGGQPIRIDGSPVLVRANAD